METNRSLAAAEAGFLRRLVRDELTDSARTGIAGYIHRKYQLGEPQSSNRLTYGPQDWARASDMLEALGGIPVTSKAADEGERGAARIERSHRIACVPLLDREPAIPSLATAYVVATPEAAQAMAPQIVVVVQTLENLEHVIRFQWLRRRLGGRSCLAVFQGGGQPFHVSAVSRLLDAITAEVWALADLDPVSLAWAARVSRVSALPYPDMHTLAAGPSSVTALRYASGIRSHAGYLASHPRTCIREAFIALQQLQGGRRVADFPD